MRVGRSGILRVQQLGLKDKDYLNIKSIRPRGPTGHKHLLDIKTRGQETFILHI